MLAFYLSLIVFLLCVPVSISLYGVGLGGLLSGIGALCFFLFHRIDERSRWGRFIAKWWPLGRSPRSFDPDHDELDPDEIEYIHNIRNESHETEIVITVGLLAGLVAVDVGAIDDWLWSLPLFLSPKTVGVVSSALVIGIWTSRIGIFAHLLLRCVWIGMVGLGFSYPRGVNRQNLAGPLQRRMYHHLTAPDTSVRLTIQMERLCSVVYAIFMCSVFSLFAWISIVFACSFLGAYASRAIYPFFVDVGIFCTQETLYVAASMVFALFGFVLWSYLRVGRNSVVRTIRQPLFEIFYFFKGTLVSQSMVAIPIAIALPPLCIVIGILHPIVDVETEQPFVYLDEVVSGSEIEVPHIPSATIENTVIHLHLPERTINVWQSHAVHTCLDNSGSVLRNERGALEKWATNSFGVWIDKKPKKMVWVQKTAEDALGGFIDLSGLDNGIHTLRVDPCNNAQHRMGLAIPFYLDVK